MTLIAVISLSLALFYFSIILIFLSGWVRLPPFKRTQANFRTKVSVIIPVRNEENNVEWIINDILQQKYPGELLEVIIVDDHSTDRTAEKVRKHEGPLIRLIQLQEDQPLNSYKKKAITEAIATASGELIITTDGDCRLNPEWVAEIVSFYEQNGYLFISAPVCFYGEKTWFEKLQTLEFNFLIGVGASSIRNKSPNTCNGANLAYSRELFYELKGFKDIDDLASGDDELFLHKVARKYPERIGFLRSEKAIVYTRARRTLKDFVAQRKRWASKTMKYKNRKISLMVAGIFLFNLSLVINGIGAFFSPSLKAVFFAQLLLKLPGDAAFLWAVTGFFKKRKLLRYFLLVEFFYILYILIIGIYGNFGGKYDWKGRMVR